MNQMRPEPEGVKLALNEIAEAREHLRLASDILGASVTTEAVQESPSAVLRRPRRLEFGSPPQDLLDIALEVIHQVFPEQLQQRAREHGTGPRDWLHRAHTLSIVPRGISEPVATIVVMLAAVKFGLRHQLLLQTETRLGLAHKTPIPSLDLFLETFISEMVEADRNDSRYNEWLQRTVAAHYPGFRKGARFDLPNGDFLIIPEIIEPIRQQAAPTVPSALTSPVDPASSVIIPPASGWLITLGFAQILHNTAYPAYHGKHHSGIDISRWDAYQAPVYAMRAGLAIASEYLPRGFGNTVLVEHDDGSCLRYTHLDKTLVKKGDRIMRGQQIGTIGKGANDMYAAHLHLDMPRSSAFARAGTYYDTAPEVAERFINPLSLIPTGV
ncbi:MAG: M23 family metallopeptidase [Chloroflexi bacterium]|nr:M23 family metallopeptidase [Chloroflexota bacterium]